MYDHQHMGTRTLPQTKNYRASLHLIKTTVFALSFAIALTNSICTAQDKTTDELVTRPLGHGVFELAVELPSDTELVPGDLVDVHLVNLSADGERKERILSRIRVHSLGEEQLTLSPESDRQPALVAPDSEALAVEVDEETKKIFPIRQVGLQIDTTRWEKLRVAQAQGVIRLTPSAPPVTGGALAQIANSFVTNLFQPLLLFFFMGFAIPLLRIPFEYPKALYESLTIYLLIAIGWHGGELMAELPSSQLAIAGGLVVVGMATNGFIGLAATAILGWITPMRKIDAVTVGAYYGSDSAGTFVTCLGILASMDILHDSYMPVMLAAMEIPGCLVGLLLVARLRRQKMDRLGNLPNEPNYQANEAAKISQRNVPSTGIQWKVLHEVFLNPGLYMLFGGLVVGFISGLQALSDPKVVEGPDHLFLFIFKGALCLFLLEMGITACLRLRDLRSAGWGFILFGMLAPNLFAIFGMAVLHGYAIAIDHPFKLGTYALFAVLCGAASYIAVPAVQRLAIPEASPTLPLAASLGLTFTWNVTLGIPIYIEVARRITTVIPIT